MNSILSTQFFKVKHGFTLIELLVVITIIGILMAMGTVAYTKAQQKSRDSKRKADLKAVQQALELYYQKNGFYPDSNNGVIRCNQTGGRTSDNQWGQAFTCDGTPFMTQLPQDPTGTIEYRYNDIAINGKDNQGYNLSSTLENTADQDYNQFPTQCAPPQRHYCVIQP